MSLSDTSWRLAFFLGGLITMFLIEIWQNGRQKGRWPRIMTNISMAAIGNILLKLFSVLSAIAVAELCRREGWGLLYWLSLPVLLSGILAFITLDLAIYWQHRCFHVIEIFWRIHKVHHSDRDLDVSTALRFHPLEIILSQVWKLVVVFVLGAPPWSVLVFELALSLCALFTHTKLRLSRGIESAVAKFLVTPAMHGRHHHCELPDTNRNFGTILNCWDHLFLSYREPVRGETLRMGLKEYRHELSLIRLIFLPFEAGKREKSE